MKPRPHHAGFTLLEIAISLALVIILLAVLLPALASARVASSRETCASHLRHCGQAWEVYLADNKAQFPYVPIQPGWHYGGVKFSSVDGHPFLDLSRPLTTYVAAAVGARGAEDAFRCPADDGIRGETSGVGTGDRSAYRSFGTSYRASARLFDAADTPDRGLRVNEIATVPSRLVIMGDPVWYEVSRATGREASWHGQAAMGNLLFLDGAVKYRKTYPPPRVGPAVFEPKLR